MLIIPDYYKKELTQPLSPEDFATYQEIANCELQQLSERHKNLLVLASDWESVKDKTIINLYQTGENTYKCENDGLMGFISYKGLKLKIRSRFDSDDKDYLLQYMLERTQSLNLFDLPFSYSSEDNSFELMMVLFPAYLKRAMAQGIYKEYRRFEYNDSNIRGVIDVPRHIRYNIPFNGKVAYNTREYTYDNRITQLIRHTIEYMRTTKVGAAVLDSNVGLAGMISQITQSTPSYSRQSRRKVIMDNLQPKPHPYFTEYEPLRALCISILRDETVLFSGEENELCGVIFYGPDLWEDYIASVLSNPLADGTQFKHYVKGDGEKLFSRPGGGRDFQEIVPDYLDKVKQIVGDAKYMRLDKDSLYADKAAEVYYKTIMYMYRYNSKKGFLFRPYSPDVFEDLEEHKNKSTTYQIKDTDGMLYKCGLEIAPKSGSYSDFKNAMKDKETKFRTSIEECLK